MVSVIQLDKKWDFAFIFKNLQDLLDENNIEEARNFAKNALSEAQAQENAEWAAKFHQILNQLAQTRNIYNDSLEGSKNDTQVIQEKSDILTNVKGVGPAIASKLNSNGFKSIKDIANSTVEQIASIPGIGAVTATKMITNTKEYLAGSKEQVSPKSQNLAISRPKEIKSHKMIKSQTIKTKAAVKSLNDWFSTKEIQGNHQSEIVSESLVEDHVNDISSQQSEIKEQSLDIEEEILVEDEVKGEDLSSPEEYEVRPLRSQNDVSHFTKSVDLETNKFQLESPINKSHVENVIVPLTELVRTSEIKINRESSPLNNSKVNKNRIYQKIANIIKDRHFHEIPLNKQEIREFKRGIDYLGCKILTVSNNSRLIVLIPIKFLASRNCLMISETDVLKPLNRNESSSLRYIPDSIAETHARQLKKVSDAMFDSFKNEGALYSLLSRYFGLDAIVQKGFRQKPLFMVAGEVEYEIIIDPVLITNQLVSSIEKSIPFPYQHSSNLHFVELKELNELIEYLEQKHALLVTQESSSNALVEQLKMKNSFYKNIKNYSYPFLIYGGLFSLLLVMQMGDLMKLFISIGFALIFIYAGTIMFVLHRYFQVLNKMTTKFMTPHYEKRAELPKEDLILISEEFSEEWITQLEHEVNYMDKQNKIPLKKNYFKSKKSNEESKKEEVFTTPKQGDPEQFEVGAVVMETEFERKQDLNELDDPILSKYRSFLDD